jgi:hypothetical protein
MLTKTSDVEINTAKSLRIKCFSCLTLVKAADIRNNVCPKCKGKVIDGTDNSGQDSEHDSEHDSEQGRGKTGAVLAQVMKIKSSNEN